MNIGIQNLDCNCNNCEFMIRDLFKREYSLKTHDLWGLMHFIAIRDRILREIRKKKKQNRIFKHKNDWKRFNKNLRSTEAMERERDKMKYQFDNKEPAIHYGECTKLNKDVSFIPNVLQLDTQKCFINRKS